MKVYINGKFYSEQNAKVSVFDHGLLYGDGVFEGIRAYHGRLFKLKEHIDRLFCSAKAILLDLPMTHAELMEATLETCRRNKLNDGYIRLVVTRGRGTLGLNPNRCSDPQVIIIAGKIQLYPPSLYKKGMEIVTVATTRNHHNAVNPAIKSLNYLNNIMAKIEANIAGYEEAIMLNAEGYVAECTGDNIFILKDGRMFTPPLSSGALHGITRGTAIDLLAELGVPTSEPNMTRYDLFNADECFLTGTGAEIVPVEIPASVALASSLHPLVMKSEGAANHKVWKRTRTDLYSDEVGKRLEAGFFIPATDYINALQYRAYALEDFLDRVLSKVDLLHTAVLPIPTPTLEQTAYRDGPAYLDMVVSLTRNTRPINFLGLPALSVTCGFTPDGLPTSFQLVGRPHAEALLFRIGHRFQLETRLHEAMPPALGRA